MQFKYLSDYSGISPPIPHLFAMLQYGSLLKVMVFTGLRLAEAIGLTWDCVDFEKRRLTINKQLQKRPLAEGGFTSTPLKNDKTRIIAPAPFVLELLKRWRQVQATVYIHFKKLATEIDAPNARVHDRRHPYVKPTTKIFSIFLRKVYGELTQKKFI